MIVSFNIHGLIPIKTPVSNKKKGSKMKTVFYHILEMKIII
jgi:hypothetical protein